VGMNGAILVVINGNSNDLAMFTEYLDAISSISVIRAREGINIEAGNCYILSDRDKMALKPLATQFALEVVEDSGEESDSLDLLLTSVATSFKDRAEAVMLAGHTPAGEVGADLFLSKGGEILILSPKECYSTVLGNHIARGFGIRKAISSRGVVQRIVNRV
jgi:chemotaxis response regulator CheB